MELFAHSGGFNTGEADTLSHVVKENFLPLLLTTALFLVALYLLSMFMRSTALSAKPVKISKSHHKEEDSDE